MSAENTQIPEPGFGGETVGNGGKANGDGGFGEIEDQSVEG